MSRHPAGKRRRPRAGAVDLMEMRRDRQQVVNPPTEPVDMTTIHPELDPGDTVTDAPTPAPAPTAAALEDWYAAQLRAEEYERQAAQQAKPLETSANKRVERARKLRAEADTELAAAEAEGLKAKDLRTGEENARNTAAFHRSNLARAVQESNLMHPADLREQARRAAPPNPLGQHQVPPVPNATALGVPEYAPGTVPALIGGEPMEPAPEDNDPTVTRVAGGPPSPNGAV